MASDPARILSELTRPGRTLAFCDETDITQGGTSTMRAGIHLLGALIRPSVLYAAMRDELESFRADRCLPEIHANEIVTPGTRSEWRAVDRVVREETFTLVCRLASSPECWIAYVHVPKGQYDEMRSQVQEGDLPRSHKSAVRRVFISSLVEHLATIGPSVLVMDRVKSRSGPTLTPLVGGEHLVGNGAISADATNVTGLQIADVALYAVGRYLRRRDKIVAESGDRFDETIMTMLADMNGRILSLLNPRREPHG